VTIREALATASHLLAQSVRNPRKEAMILMRTQLGCTDTYLIAHDDETLADEAGYFALVDRRVAHEPLQYITGVASFYSRDFVVREGVLVPRPETEILVDKTCELAREFDARTIAEIGSGSGVISVMLALLLPDAQLIATDISPAAVALSRENAAKFGVADRIDFRLSSYLDGVGEVDIIVSNPPYIRADEELERQVLNEPHEALFGGREGDEVLKNIILLFQKRRAKALACEMGHDQRASIEAFLAQQNIKNYSFYKDLSGLDRGFVIRRDDE
jgi:release factor glutamine methyltransferase